MSLTKSRTRGRRDIPLATSSKVQEVAYVYATRNFLTDKVACAGLADTYGRSGGWLQGKHVALSAEDLLEDAHNELRRP